MRCIYCKNTHFETQEHAMLSVVDGFRYTAVAPANQCTTCASKMLSDFVIEEFEDSVLKVITDEFRVGPEAHLRLRSAAGITARAWARLIGVTPQCVTRWEKCGPINKAAFIVLSQLATEAIAGKKDLRIRMQGSATVAEISKLDPPAASEPTCFGKIGGDQ